MNRKQFTLIIIIGAIIGGFGFWQYRRQSTEWKSSGEMLGQKVLGDFPLNDVAHVVIKHTNSELNLEKKEDLWTVRERNHYPANFSDLSEFLKKLWELKSVQVEKIGPSQFPRLELIEPGKGDKSGTLVDLKDKSGKTIKSLLLGKKHMKKPSSPSPYGGDEGWPDGRYVMALTEPKTVALISEAFSNIEPKPEQWLNKDFFKVEKIRSVSVTHTNATNSWKLSRETESGEAKLAEAKPGEQLDTAKSSGVMTVLSYPSFSDLTAKDAKPEDTGMDQPILAKIETFDQYVYDVKIGKKTTEDNYHLAVNVAANLVKERTPGKDEKPEDKEKLDKEFNEKLSKQEEKLKQEKTFENWTFIVSKWTIDNLLKERKDLMAEKKEEKKEEAKDKPSAENQPAGKESLAFEPKPE